MSLPAAFRTSGIKRMFTSPDMAFSSFFSAKFVTTRPLELEDTRTPIRDEDAIVVFMTSTSRHSSTSDIIFSENSLGTRAKSSFAWQ